ncbi:hypothetical protein Bca4012_031060 [Brassica carinata]|uniref:Uncharacterized protein n=2 Tax=Brassica TaxID=3705 RepID=A0ABQ7ZW24_BRANA|nr:hypothetical protein F2Q69_00014428 [Brassica cretica]KAH0884424.1 hypothetical protein HID58_060520 [Brassica napus]
MTRANVLALCMVVLVLGMIMEETEGQEWCHDYMTGKQKCEAKHCAAQCKRKWKGVGRCMPSSTQCLCTFKCNY